MESQGKLHFYSYTLAQLEELMIQWGHKKFRGKQLYKWVYEKGVYVPEKMTDLAKDFRTELSQKMDFTLPPMVDRRISMDETRKYLFDIGKGQTVEAVMIPSDNRTTLCLSSEVGCNLACKFCFTGKQKLKRRLTAGEIVGQFVQVMEDMGRDRISNIVFMGMGEPLDNTDAVFAAIEVFKNDHGLNLSRKKITVSTSGLVPQMPLITESGTRLASKS